MQPQPRLIRRKLKYFGQMALLRSMHWLRPNSEWVLFHLGNAYAEHGEPESALQLWSLACTHDKPRPAALRNLGATLLRLGRPAEAVPPLQKLTTAATTVNQVEAYTLLGLACRRAQLLPEAVAAYNKLLSLQPDNDTVRLTLGMLLEKTQQYKSALTHYRQITDPQMRSRVSVRVQQLELLT